MIYRREVKRYKTEYSFAVKSHMCASLRCIEITSLIARNTRIKKIPISKYCTIRQI